MKKIWTDRGAQVDRIQKMAREIHKQIRLHGPNGETIVDYKVVQLPEGRVAHVYDYMEWEGDTVWPDGGAIIYDKDMNKVALLTMDDYEELVEMATSAGLM